MNQAFQMIGAIMIVGLPALVVQADYQSMTAVLHTTTNTPDGVKSVFRVYAVFSSPGDFLRSIAGSPSHGNMVIRNTASVGMGLGSGFYNLAETTTAPHLTVDAPEEYQWETFVAIGGPVFDESDHTWLSPGFPAFFVGSEWNTNSAAWFSTPVAQCMAGNGVANVDGHGNWGVLAMQLTVSAGEHVAGTVAVSGINNSPLAGGTTFETIANQTFNSFPAPGGLALVVIVGLVRSRRRKRQENCDEVSRNE